MRRQTVLQQEDRKRAFPATLPTSSQDDTDAASHASAPLTAASLQVLKQVAALDDAVVPHDAVAMDDERRKSAEIGDAVTSLDHESGSPIALEFVQTLIFLIIGFIVIFAKQHCFYFDDISDQRSALQKEVAKTSWRCQLLAFLWSTSSHRQTPARSVVTT